MMAAPFAALGLLSICQRLLVWSERFSMSKAFCRIAVVVPIAIVLLSSAGIALGRNNNSRGAEVELAQWVRQEYGPSAQLFGSEGVTPVIAYYAEARYSTLTKNMSDKEAIDLTTINKPDVVLISATRRMDLHDTRKLIDEIRKLGYHEMERNRLPLGIDDVLVVLGREKESKLTRSHAPRENVIRGASYPPRSNIIAEVHG
jgi:hypothetical protein